MGVMPHTVQIYGLDDPAPTSGNTDFGYIRDFLHEEAGKRLVVWYPETAYWVSYDVDVPLFLPVYAERRVADLQLLADDEDLGLMGRGAEASARMDGQVIFSSGWEWGYWLNDVVAARASWDPFHGEDTSEASMRAILAPLARVLGSEGNAIVAEVARLATVQHAVLLYGDIDGARPADVVRRNGIAYLAGVEAFDDVLDVARSTGLADATAQPDRLGLVEMRNPLRDPPAYTGEIDLLLAHMVDVFGASLATFDGLSADGPGADLRPSGRHPLDVVEKDWADDPWARGGYVAFLPPGACTGLGRDPVGRLHFAGTETASQWHGYMEGAILAGERAAHEVLAALA